MDKFEVIIKTVTVGAAAFMTYFFGGVDVAFGILLSLITIDYITGITAAIVEEKLSSEVGRKGIAKKVGILVLVAVSHLVGTYTGFDIKVLVVGYYIGNEGISILENTSRMGVPYPKKLKTILQQLKDGDSNEDIS